MSALFDQFLSEARESLEGVCERLTRMEEDPQNASLMNELFRLVHTLKGNSGLFDFPEMTRVLHASEDLMSAVRDGRVAFSRELSDRLLDAMDYVSSLCDIAESGGTGGDLSGEASARLTEALRVLVPTPEPAAAAETELGGEAAEVVAIPAAVELDISVIPEHARAEAFRVSHAGTPLHLVTYTPVENCFFQGTDPLFSVLQGPRRVWGRIFELEPWPALATLNTYRCVLAFQTLVASDREAIVEHYRYVIDQVSIVEVAPLDLLTLEGDPNGGPADEDFVADALLHLTAGDYSALRQGTETMLELSSEGTWTSTVLRWMLVLLDYLPADQSAMALLIDALTTQTQPNWNGKPAPAEDAVHDAVSVVVPPTPVGDVPATPARVPSERENAVRDSIFRIQRRILLCEDRPAWHQGRLLSVVASLINCSRAAGDDEARRLIEDAAGPALDSGDPTGLVAWLDALVGSPRPAIGRSGAEAGGPSTGDSTEPNSLSDGPDFKARTDDAPARAKSLKVDQTRIDRLMDLIGEMVVSKNALPYLAARAETQYGSHELSREIRAQYAVINRIAEEMQDAIMQVRMTAVSFVFQRFPRMVREISRKLGKEVKTVLVGEETEIDKNIIESLADPLVHIVRNSVDHGIELPDTRRAAGKPAAGTLVLRASQEADRVVIEISDDGKGIDPGAMRRKAYEKGFIDEATMERLTDRDAIDLLFVPGLSTTEVVSDLSGRGVGMDVVRTAVEKCNGDIEITSDLGKGTSIRISLPVSMAVSRVMIVESDGQLFGVPIDHVMETVRIPQGAVQAIKRNLTTTLRNKVIPLKALNSLLGLPTPPRVNAENELAVLVVKLGAEPVGIIVDDFRETVDIIQKPLDGAIGQIAAFSGSAIIGDGSVLMVLNIKGVL